MFIVKDELGTHCRAIVQIAPSEPAPRYQTRNPNRHPGIEAGLAPRTREQVQAVAQAKKAHAAEELAAQEAEQAARQAEKHKNLGNLAEIMDKQAREEVQDRMSFSESFSIHVLSACWSCRC